MKVTEQSALPVKGQVVVGSRANYRTLKRYRSPTSTLYGRTKNYTRERLSLRSK